MVASRNAPQHKSLCIVVGDPSADRHTGKIIPHLRKAAPGLHLWGTGGSTMAAAGVETLHNCEDFNVIGIFELVKHLGFYVKLKAQIIEEIGKRKPSAVLLVDNGGFNLKLAPEIRQKYPELPILYFISPQVWASRPYRMKTIAKNISKVLTIFPFEEELYRKRGIAARFVGNPLVRNMPSPDQFQPKEEFCQRHGLDANKPIIGIFAGSRRQEIKTFTHILLLAIRLINAQRPEVQFVLSLANEKLGQAIKQKISMAKMDAFVGQSIHFVDSQDNYSLMYCSDVVWAKSGTTTLEVTLCGTPMLVFYRGMWLTYLIYCVFMTVKKVGWPNLLAGQESLVPELIQLDCRAEQFVKYTNDLLDVPALRKEISARLLTFRDQLGQGDYAVNVAEELLAAIQMPQKQVTSG